MREMQHLHETRNDAVLHASDDALQTHTRRMPELEDEYVRRDPDAMWTRTGCAPAQARERVSRLSSKLCSKRRTDAYSSLHDMGGDIGPASIAGSGDRRDI